MRRILLSLVTVLATSGLGASALAYGGRPTQPRVHISVGFGGRDAGYGQAYDDAAYDDAAYDDAADDSTYDDAATDDSGYDDSTYDESAYDRGDDGCDDAYAPAPVVPLGARVDVQWGSSWWSATVLDAQRGLYLVHYNGYAGNWDEWVTLARIRSPLAVAPSADPVVRHVFWNDAPQRPARPYGGHRAAR
ncbi:MAG: Tudor-knot domain-containing protein [Myxococcota bacterium]